MPWRDSDTPCSLSIISLLSFEHGSLLRKDLLAHNRAMPHLIGACWECMCRSIMPEHKDRKVGILLIFRQGLRRPASPNRFGSRYLRTTDWTNEETLLNLAVLVQQSLTELDVSCGKQICTCSSAIIAGPATSSPRNPGVATWTKVKNLK